MLFRSVMEARGRREREGEAEGRGGRAERSTEQCMVHTSDGGEGFVAQVYIEE